jgi:ectoine hydroxylase-related dioxygenase (phytanoyl-CoA dioxygenase family)
VIKHDRNRDFVWENHSGPYRIVSPEQARDYDERGFFVFRNAFDAETIEALIAEIDPIEEQLETLVRERFDGRMFIVRAGEITFTPHAVTRSNAAREFTRSAFFRDVTFDLLGPDVRLYWDQSVYKKPGTADEFPWHQDNGYTYVEPQQYLTCWVALTDTDERNGCPVVLPGLHREGTWAHQMTDLGWDCGAGESGVDSVATPARAGDVVVFSSLTPHKTGPNLTEDSIRKSYIVQFAPDGACVITENDGSTVRTRCDAPERQYPILIDGAVPPDGD